MEIIYHTADIKKDEDTLEKLFSSGNPTVELDFIMSVDGVPIWTHNLLPTQLLYSKSSTLKKYLTLYDVLEINNHRTKLMLDMKLIPMYILKSKKFRDLLNKLNQYDEMQIESLDLTFLDQLTKGKYNNFELGLIVNILTKWCINKTRIPDLSNLSFFALSSELWEKNNGSYIDKCSKLYPNIKKYAWTWAIREENDERLSNFINHQADGIITDKVDKVKELIK